MLRRARIPFQRLLPLLVALARLVTPATPALDPAPALSKHWGGRPATLRLAAAVLLVVLTSVLLVAAMRSAIVLPLARWVLH